MGRRIQSLADEVVKRMDEQDMRRGFACLGGFRMRSCRGRDLFRRVSQGFRWCDRESELMNASDDGLQTDGSLLRTQAQDLSKSEQPGGSSLKAPSGGLGDPLVHDECLKGLATTRLEGCEDHP